MLVAVKARYACASTTCSSLPCLGGLSAGDEKKHGLLAARARRAFFLCRVVTSIGIVMVGEAAREKRAVWDGRLAKTKGGLTREQLMESKSGKIVSKKQHAAGKRLHARGLQEGWLHSPIHAGAPLKRKGVGRKAAFANQVFTNAVDDARHNGRAYLGNATLSAHVPKAGATARNCGNF